MWPCCGSTSTWNTASTSDRSVCRGTRVRTTSQTATSPAGEKTPVRIHVHTRGDGDICYTNRSQHMQNFILASIFYRYVCFIVDLFVFYNDVSDCFYPFVIKIDWLIDWLINWLIDWLIDRLIDRLIDWLTDWLIAYFTKNIEGGPKNRTVFRLDNFVTVSPRKACSMSKFSKFYREKRYKTRILVSLNILCQICSNRHNSWNCGIYDQNTWILLNLH